MLKMLPAKAFLSDQQIEYYLVFFITFIIYSQYTAMPIFCQVFYLLMTEYTFRIIIVIIINVFFLT